MTKLGVRTVETDDFSFVDGSIISKGGKRTPYRLLVEGKVENKVQLSYQELLALPSVTQTSDFHCVEGWSVPDLVWKGFRFAEIVRLAKPRPDAHYVIFHALGETEHEPHGQNHYIECLPVTHLLDSGKECLLTLKMNGNPLPQEHGAPLRVIAPYDLAYKSIKFVYKIEFSSEEKSGWWTLANPIYPRHAPVPASRLRRK
ncbi:MAG: molybdopterin-dependent oxidoreductase [Acidobacteriota bacterium]|nr:molybdopterin-dependent oxidoreductase [Acidobacteriota bacterium]